MKRDPGSYERWLQDRDAAAALPHWRAGDRFQDDGGLTGTIETISTYDQITAYSVLVDGWSQSVVIPAWALKRCTKLEV